MMKGAAVLDGRAIKSVGRRIPRVKAAPCPPRDPA
jgi:hypothetical protein